MRTTCRDNFKFNLNSKTKCTTSKKPRRCKLQTEGEVIKQELKFVEITNCGNLEEEVPEQVAKAIRIFKTAIRPVIIYTTEKHVTPLQIKTIAEMKILRKITGTILIDRERSEYIRQRYNTKNINDCREKENVIKTKTV